MGDCHKLARTLVMTLAMVGCDRGPASESASPETATRAAASSADTPAEAAVDAPGDRVAGPSPTQAGGLASAVEREVDEARKHSALPQAQAPVVPAGAPLVAVVAGVPIPRSAFDEVYGLKVKKYSDRGRTIPESADRRYRKSIVERLVHHERLRQRVVEIGVDFDPVVLAERTEQQRRGIRNWAEHLERRGETDDSLRAMVIAELREGVILERAGRLEVSRAELEADYDEIKGNWSSSSPRIRASHIVVSIAEAGPGDDPPALEAAARAEADRLYALATAPGADFAAVAREHSSGPSAPKGGDIGIFTADRMEETFSKVAFAMAVGAVSKPVKTKFGFHIIHVTGKWPPGELPIEALEDDIDGRLRQRKLHAERRALKEELELAYPVTHHLLTPEEQAFRGSPSPRPGAPGVEPEPEEGETR
jgi:hypothetical protein